MNLGPMAAPLAGLFELGVCLRRLAYDRGWLAVAPAPVTTVSVGGLEVGGTGKTPVTEKLLGAFLRCGRRAALLTRGYGRITRGLVLRRIDERVDPMTIGDEPAMLVASGLNILVAASERRPLGMQALCAQGVDTVVMDDAFSHRAQARHVDIVVLSGEAPFGNGHLMPWGALREPPSSLRRANVVWLHFRREAALTEPEWWRRLCGHAVRVVSEARVSPAVDANGTATDLAGRRVLAAAGIARPSEFFRAVESLGADVVERLSLSDHARFDVAAVERLNALAVRPGATSVVVTPKDAIKLKPIWRGLPLIVVGTWVDIKLGATELAHVLGVPTDLL